MERKGIHPNILAAIIGAAATLVAALITVAVTSSRDRPAVTPETMAERSDLAPPAPLLLGRTYSYRNGPDAVTLTFSDPNKWRLTSGGAIRGSAQGTYRIEGNVVVLLVTGGTQRPPGFEETVRLTAADEGVLVVDTSKGAPAWRIPPVR